MNAVAENTTTTSLHDMTREEMLETFIEVSLPNGTDDFLKVRETIERMGVTNRAGDTLFQSCHILHKQGRYYIVHFKELYALDGRTVDMSEEDYARRNTIAKTLERWGMCQIETPQNASGVILGGRGGLTILRHAERETMNLQPKYRMGSKGGDA